MIAFAWLGLAASAFCRAVGADSCGSPCSPPATECEGFAVRRGNKRGLLVAAFCFSLVLLQACLFFPLFVTFALSFSSCAFGVSM